MDVIKNAKVVSQRIWHNETISHFNVSASRAGFYFFKGVNSEGEYRSYECNFEEVSVKEVVDGVYRVGFHAISSEYGRTNAFIELEINRQKMTKWTLKDIWFQEETHYLVRRLGYNFYGVDKQLDSGTFLKCKRCVHCRRSLTPEQRETHECNKIYYTVDEDMKTVKMA